MLLFSDSKPVTAVTTYIDKMTVGGRTDNDLSGIVELSEVVGLTSTGPKEAARTLRKKLKYGRLDEQVRALIVLQALIENAGSHFVENFSDEKLEERIFLCATSPAYPKKVRIRAYSLIKLWQSDYSNVRGMENLSKLARKLPSKMPPLSIRQQQPINMKRVAPILERLIVSSNMAATNLANTLAQINPHRENPTHNKQIMMYYVDCKRCHRSLLRYIEAIQDEMWLANLLKTNDEIVSAIDSYKEKTSHNEEQDDDFESGSDSYSLNDRASYLSGSDVSDTISQTEEDLDANNPFSDLNRTD
ncbi:cortical component Lsb5 [Schizosaccharomyces cryophilus OY26]|uniref:Cortical component Lsb5 n=1 Tax=Schizosaccharomyces cryophilus (strain OY26 / ATCC MYA-4695 / CBS 11777 / NBRC 106824 / NRRL Y48691) TaxID=653667 RepID=S9W710_SCHCR|nr:cortical component Lsb5 [Schizosaccharomyces cryophilus OY26]EPY53670.1 cortical component Lsb5 [Schizosaccharomyces cryophilus OY26]